MLDEIEKLMNSADTSFCYRIVNLGGRHLYIEGIKSVVSFGTNKMSFQMKKNRIDILGQDLSIKYLDKSTCIILGEIKSVVEL